MIFRFHARDGCDQRHGGLADAKRMQACTCDVFAEELINFDQVVDVIIEIEGTRT